MTSSVCFNKVLKLSASQEFREKPELYVEDVSMLVSSKFSEGKNNIELLLPFDKCVIFISMQHSDGLLIYLRSI